MRIFYLHAVSSFGGSAKSLVELFAQLKLHGVKGDVLCPSGYSQQALSNIGMTIHNVFGLAQFDNTLFGYYRKLRWIVLLREIAFTIPTLIALFKIKFKIEKFDLIHVNEITLLPVGILAKKLFKCPLVVHIRSVQRGNSNDFRTKLLFNLLKMHADAVVVIDETVKASIPDFVNATIVHNGINLPDHYETLNQKTMSVIPRVGIVGSLLRLKGIYEFLNAAMILLKERNIAIQFVVVGENARSSNGIIAWVYKKLGFSDDTMKDMLKFINVHNIKENFIITGFIKDVRDIYSNLDILCFPSYLNAAGRPVFEAALFGVPSIVAIDDPKSDTIIDQETGICIKKSCSHNLADAIEYMVKNPQERLRLGYNAQKLAFKHFNIQENAKIMVEIYKILIFDKTSNLVK